MLARGLVLCTSVSQTGQLNDVSKYLTIQLLQTKMEKQKSIYFKRTYLFKLNAFFNFLPCLQLLDP